MDSKLSDLDYLKLKKQQALEKEEKEIMNIHPERLKILVDKGLVDPSKITNLYKKDEDVKDMVTVEPKQEQIVVADYEDETPSPDTIADTGRIMIRNLPFSTTYEDIEQEFKRFGPIVEIHLPHDKLTKESKGYCFILYMIPENAIKAYDTMDKQIFQGRIIEIVAAKERKIPQPETQISMTFKQKREQVKKEKSSSDFNWSSLFMNV